MSASELSHSTPLAVIILAAGKGTRMRSNLPKLLHQIADLPMVSHVVRTVIRLNPDYIIPVIAPQMEDVRETAQKELDGSTSQSFFAIQTEQLGTGHAVKCAVEELERAYPEFCGNVLVLCGDVPLVGADCLKDFLADFNAHSGFGASFMAMVPPDPTGFGRIFQNADGTLKDIIEEKDANPEQKLVRLVNSGIGVFRSKNFLKYLGQLGKNNRQGEYYLVDIPKILNSKKIGTGVFRGPYRELRGVNSRAQLAELEQYWQEMKRLEMMESGVTLQDPATVYFSHDTQIGQDCVIGSHVIFGPQVRIEANVEIKPFSHIEGATIQSGASIGPFARIRPHSHIDEGVKIGNFVEVKNSHIKRGAKANHLGYIGDAELGEQANFGCGAITVNYDGQHKSKTLIGDYVMVGSNATLIAPVEIGEGAYIAAGSTVTQDVEPDALVVGRSKQISLAGKAKGRLKRS